MPKGERRLLTIALIAFLVGIIVLCFADIFLPETPPTENVGVDRVSTRVGAPHEEPAPAATSAPATQSKAINMSPFDPNTVTPEQMERLGMKPWLIRRIEKMREGGFVFKGERDFAQIYGLNINEFRRLQPYIRIDSSFILPASTLFALESSPEPRHTKLGEGEKIDLNHADTTLLKRIPGIGSYYASRIYDYGERLGGYVSTAQLEEIEGLPPGVEQYVEIGDTSIRHLDLDTLSMDQLRRHPYITYRQAKAIIELRRRQGHIGNLDQLALHPLFSHDDIERLRPYVE